MRFSTSTALVAATVFAAAFGLAPTGTASAQVPEADKAAFIAEDVADCVQLQRFSLPRKDIPATQYKAFCECRADHLARHSTPADYRNLKEKMIPMRKGPEANRTCEMKIFGREL